MKLFTAIVSLATVAALVPLVPRALGLRSPDELEREVARRQRAEEDLQRTLAGLEEETRASREASMGRSIERQTREESDREHDQCLV